jgi:hypothetical protein
MTRRGILGDEAIDHTVWRTGFERYYGQTRQGMNNVVKFRHQNALQIHACANHHGSTSHSLRTTGPRSWFRVTPKNYCNIDHNEILPKPIQFAVYYDTIMRPIITSSRQQAKQNDVKQNDEQAVRRGTNSSATSCWSIAANCRIY